VIPACEHARFGPAGITDPGYSYRRSGEAASTLVSNGESVVATFFLMRYQRVVASRRETNFARQLFRIHFFVFIIALEKNLADAFAESLRGEIALDPAPMTNRDPTRLF
jgi:hypothetical protein